MTSGLVSISAPSDQAVKLINNTFELSASYFGTNLVVITKQDTSEEVTMVDGSNRCGAGIEVVNNTFNRIVGTFLVDTGLIRVQCNNTHFAEQSKQAQEVYSFMN